MNYNMQEKDQCSTVYPALGGQWIYDYINNTAIATTNQSFQPFLMIHTNYDVVGCCIS